MTGLPILLRRAPYLFYGMAVVFFVWYLANAWFGLAAINPYSDPSLEAIENIQKSDHLFRASLDAVYLAANGAIIHVLIAIYDRLAGAAE